VGALVETRTVKVFGLTGGIASGKTVVSDWLHDLGAAVIDLDLIAREVVTPGEPALSLIFEHFGDTLRLADGTLNRRALREIIFTHPAERHWLNALLHPLIRTRLAHRVSELKSINSAPYIIVVVPLLAAAPEQYAFDGVIVVDCAEPRQRERLQRRDGHAEREAQLILDSQPSRQQRLDLADFVLHNEGDLSDLHTQVRQLDQRLRTPPPKGTPSA